MSDETGGERVSRFREHTNTNSSIRPPPDELWKDVDMETLIDNFTDENERTPAVRKASHPRQMLPSTYAAPSTAAARKGSDAAATVATAEGTFGRFSRVFAHVFGGVLGKRKAGHADAEPSVTPQQAALDERKRQAEEAYHVAKAQGLLPAPKVFVRPGMTPRAWSAGKPLASSIRRVSDHVAVEAEAEGEADTSQTHPRVPDRRLPLAHRAASPAAPAARTSPSSASSTSASPASSSSWPRPRRNSSPS